MKRFVSWLFLAFFGIAVALALMEIFVRLFLPQPLSAVKRHPILGWLDKPGARYVYTRQEFSVPVQINSQGFRDYEYSLEKPPGVFRIAVVGDSFPEGIQVPFEETFPKRMEAELRKKNPKIEVLNCGISGFGVDQYLLLIRERILSYSPDLVIVLFAPNDMDDTIRKDIAWLENGKLRLRQASELSFKTRLASEIKSFLRQHSMLWILFTDRLNDFKLTQKFLRWSWRAVGDPRQRRQTEGLAGSVKQYLRNTPPEIQRGWDLTGAILREIQTSLAQRKVSFLLVLGTLREEVDPARFGEMLSKNNLLPAQADGTKVHRTLLRIAGQYDISCLDLLPPLRRSALRGEEPHWKIDGHWSSLGHEIVSNEILAEMRRRRLLPKGL